LWIHGFIFYCDHKSWLQKGLVCTLQYEFRILIISWFTNPNLERFISYCTSRIQPIFKRFDLLSWIQQSSQILVHRRTLNKSESIPILCFGFANPYGIQKMCIVDSIHKPVFKRYEHTFNLWNWLFGQKWSLDRISRDRKCVSALDQKVFFTRLNLFVG
jgi:hypothetical protein